MVPRELPDMRLISRRPIDAVPRPCRCRSFGCWSRPTGSVRLDLVSEVAAHAPLPPQIHAASLHDLVNQYVDASLADGDLGAVRPLRLLRDRVEYLLAEHARLAHEVDRRPWREVAEALGVSPSTMSSWHRVLLRTRPSGAAPRPSRGP